MSSSSDSCFYYDALGDTPSDAPFHMAVGQDHWDPILVGR